MKYLIKLGVCVCGLVGVALATASAAGTADYSGRPSKGVIGDLIERHGARFLGVTDLGRGVRVEAWSTSEFAFTLSYTGALLNPTTAVVHVFGYKAPSLKFGAVFDIATADLLGHPLATPVARDVASKVEQGGCMKARGRFVRLDPIGADGWTVLFSRDKALGSHCIDLGSQL